MFVKLGSFMFSGNSSICGWKIPVLSLDANGIGVCELDSMYYYCISVNGFEDALLILIFMHFGTHSATPRLVNL